MMRSRVVLPLPEGPSSAVREPSLIVEVDLVKDRDVAEALGEVADGDGHA